MNIVEAFATYMQDNLSLGTLGQDIFIGEAPSSNRTNQIPIWWVKANGGETLIANQTGEKVKQYTIEVYYRSRNYRDVYTAISNLEVSVNCDGCVQLSGFDTIDIEAFSYPIDEDLDDEERKIGLLQINITVHKECE